jgi:multidrug efflux system membrane fusion protein
LATGTLTTFDNQIDTTTGTFKLRASFANDDNALFPNQFVNARLLVDTLKGVTRVPVAAVQQGLPGAFVYVINADNTVSVKTVKIGVTDGKLEQVLSGLSPGDRVVTDGTDRLRDGAKVTVPAAKTAGTAATGTAATGTGPTGTAPTGTAATTGTAAAAGTGTGTGTAAAPGSKAAAASAPGTQQDTPAPSTGRHRGQQSQPGQ